MKFKNTKLLLKLRRFYFEKEWNHKQVQEYLYKYLNIEVSLRTLKRWKKNLKNKKWRGPSIPTPPAPETKVTQEQIIKICVLRRKTGWGPLALKHVFKWGFSESTYKRIIKANGLSRGSKMENKRIHWVKWERNHPDSLWQVDAHLHDGKWLLPVIDDCSRYCLGIREFERMTTIGVIDFLDDLIEIHGLPRELLTDNGSEFGGRSKKSQFDYWCKERNIRHIRSHIHKPTTAGKVERHHLTFQNEISFCQGDLELFRYRYNHIRPHRSLQMKTPAEVYFDLNLRIKIMSPKPLKKWG